MLKIEQVFVKQIIEYCKIEYPHEACGILAGRDNVEVVYKMENNSDTPELCYFMEPEEQLKVFKELRKSGLKMLGIYHSHPKSIAYPSKKDCELAFYPEAVYVIVSLEDFENPDIKFFNIINGKIGVNDNEITN